MVSHIFSQKRVGSLLRCVFCPVNALGEHLPQPLKAGGTDAMAIRIPVAAGYATNAALLGQKGSRLPFSHPPATTHTVVQPGLEAANSSQMQEEGGANLLGRNVLVSQAPERPGKQDIQVGCRLSRLG